MFRSKKEMSGEYTSWCKIRDVCLLIINIRTFYSSRLSLYMDEFQCDVTVKTESFEE